MSHRGSKPRSAEISGELFDRVEKLSKEKGISKREALDSIVKGENTSITTFFPVEFTSKLQQELIGTDRNERVLAYQEIGDAANAAKNAQQLKNEIKKGDLIDLTGELLSNKILTEKERLITEKSKQDYYRSRDIDSQDRKEIRRIAIEERTRLAGEKGRGA